MQSFSVAQAKAHLSEIIHRVESGEDVVITRRGEPVVRLVSEAKLRPLRSRAALRSQGPALGTGAERLVRDIRDSSRY